MGGDDNSSAKKVGGTSSPAPTPSPTAATTTTEPKPGEKRRKEEEEDEDESRKKRKKEEAVAGGVAGAAKGRTTRGSSLEKSTGPAGNKGKGGKGSGSDRRSPTSLTNSAASSPSRQTRQQHQQEQDESDSDGDGGNSKKSSDSAESLKVPPLKIVLSGNGNGNGNGNGRGSGNGAPGGGVANTPTEGGEEARKGESSSAATATATAAAAVAATTALKEEGDEATSAEALSKIVEDRSEEASSSGSLDGAKAASAARMTRSRANQGTPGPEGTSSSTTGTYRGDASGAIIADTLVASTESSGGSATEAAVTGSSREEGSLGRNSHYTEYHVKKRKLRSQVEQMEQSAQGNGGSSGSRIASSSGPVGLGMISGGVSATVTAGSSAGGAGGGSGGTSMSGISPTGNEPLNDIQKYLNIRRQVEQRRKNLFPVHPKPPQGYRDYLMNRKTYLLQGNASERLRSMPMLQPPPSLEGAMRHLFLEQEKARYQLRKRHLVEKEKLVLTVEQEIIRVHGRAARALANQPFPYSVCTILRDEEIYTPIDSQAEEKNRDIRSRYNGRLFLSWLQDVDDKWEKIKVSVTWGKGHGKLGNKCI